MRASWRALYSIVLRATDVVLELRERAAKNMHGVSEGG